MKRSTLLWILTIIITIAVSYVHRVTGPTYPITGKTLLDDQEIKFRFEKSHGGTSDAPVKITTSDETIRGELQWKRYKVAEPWRFEEMIYENGVLIGFLPHQPPAGKLAYQVHLSKEEAEVLLPQEESVVIRFKGEIPAYFLLPHILFMLFAFLFSVRAGMECFSKETVSFTYAYAAIISIAVGGLILGPIVQNYAFNAWWTGFPFGTDLTDNKTAVAFIVWLVTILMLKKSKNPKLLLLIASFVTIAVYLIPHSMFGSELDYSSMN